MGLAPIKLPKQFKNTPAECDAALGAYIRAWSGLELAIFQLFHKLLDTNIVTSRILFHAGIDQRTIRGILEALGKERLCSSDFRKLQSVLRRMKTVATVRNRLVHGRWQINLELKKGTRDAKTGEWVRFYDPVDPDILQRMFRKKPDQRLLSAYQFTLEQISQKTKYVNTLTDDLNTFTKRVSLHPARTPQPVF